MAVVEESKMCLFEWRLGLSDFEFPSAFGPRISDLSGYRLFTVPTVSTKSSTTQLGRMVWSKSAAAPCCQTA
jgi:hypothetical protein